MAIDNIKPAHSSVAAVPLYDRIRADLRGRILSGEWPEGAKIPGRARLATDYGVDLNTLQRAISGLVAEGLLQADSRRGTFIADIGEKPSNPPNEHIGGSASEFASNVPATGPVAIIGTVNRVANAGQVPANFWLPTVQSAEAQLSADGFVTEFYNQILDNGVASSLANTIERAIACPVSGLVIIGATTEDPEIDKVIDRILALPSPSVIVNHAELPYDVNQAYFNHKRFGFLAAQRLLKAGHKRTVFLAPYSLTWIIERAKGAQLAFSQYGYREDALTIFPKEPMPGGIDPDFSDAGYRLGREILEQGTIPTAVIAANDNTAYGFVRAMTEANLDIGKSYNIIGFDDDDYARMISLSTFRPPLHALGREAARMITMALHGEHGSMKIELSPSFVARTSTSPIPGLTPQSTRYDRAASGQHRVLVNRPS